VLLFFAIAAASTGLPSPLLHAVFVLHAPQDTWTICTWVLDLCTSTSMDDACLQQNLKDHISQCVSEIAAEGLHIGVMQIEEAGPLF
jgi:hypothetical protein